MKPEVTLKYLAYIRDKKNKGEEGFTLIELLVVVIIIGVLAAVALPNLLGQVGKARESEMKNAVGTVNRSQQTYHFEKQTFAADTSTLGITVPATYIDDVDTAITGGSSTTATMTPTNTDYEADGTRAYSGRTEYSAGNYSVFICQSDAITDVLTAPSATGGCTGGTLIQ